MEKSSQATDGAGLLPEPGTIATESLAFEPGITPASPSSQDYSPTQWKAAPPPERKLFGRYNELMLLLIGFALTSVLGFYFQNRVQTANERRASQEAKAEKDLDVDRSRRERESQFLADTLFRATQLRLQLRQDALNRIADAREAARLRVREEQFRRDQDSLARLVPLQGAQLDRATDLADNVSGTLLASLEAARDLAQFWSFGDTVPLPLRVQYDLAKRSLVQASERRARMRNVAPMRIRLYFGQAARYYVEKGMRSFDCIDRLFAAPVSSRRVDYDKVQAALDFAWMHVDGLNEYLASSLEMRQRGITGGPVDSTLRDVMEAALQRNGPEVCAYLEY